MLWDRGAAEIMNKSGEQHEYEIPQKPVMNLNSPIEKYSGLCLVVCL